MSMLVCSFVYHCSPTAALPCFRPRPPRAGRTKRLGLNAAKSTHFAAPSTSSSLIASPETGAHRIPQQLWPQQR